MRKLAVFFIVIYFVILLAVTIRFFIKTGPDNTNDPNNTFRKQQSNSFFSYNVSSFSKNNHAVGDQILNGQSAVATSQMAYPIVTAYLEPNKTTSAWVFPKQPLPIRLTNASILIKRVFPAVQHCNDLLVSFPIDQYPTEDPYLPWIHDIFPSNDGKSIHFIAQNRRRCHTGDNHIDTMKYWEPQIALFQPVAVKRIDNSNVRSNDEQKTESSEQRFRLSTNEEADSDGIETRFLCRFKTYNLQDKVITIQGTTLSTYPFNYEYVNWRKGRSSMFKPQGKEMESFWLSQMMFDCPVPANLIQPVRTGSAITKDDLSTIFVDITPIRTPVRGTNEEFFRPEHGGPRAFDAMKNWGRDHYLPKIDDSGRWENIPICKPQRLIAEHNHAAESSGGIDEAGDNILHSGATIGDSTPQIANKKPFRLVACTWTSAAHNRRGDARTIGDGNARLKEWIAFHLLVGFDHIVVYDNTAAATSDANNSTSNLKSVVQQFSKEKVTHINWSCKICNNNRPAHKDPGERSSQYAAEASCRARFGPMTDWMASMDPDEYFVPMGSYNNWKPIVSLLDEEGRKILKFRSTRARLRMDITENYYDDNLKECKKVSKAEKDETTSCLTTKADETFLRSYNCEYIKSPKPERFQRAMKQIYRPDFVQSHFVHYSTVTTDLTRTRAETGPSWKKLATNNDVTERFIDEINEGVLVHTKTTTPDETVYRDRGCFYKPPKNVPKCPIGIPCPDDLSFSDATHNDGFKDYKGNYCNCWINRKVEDFWVPKLEAKLKQLIASL